ncbi:MAG: fatty acid CoA ligase family protein [Rhodopirellula sp. JB055]|uniref:fatty acid CoA ligase family protein n=1 Tax=Rhodopirellula sp. JB055 TaxID=3342846 RepID=UPI00370C0BFA
MSDGPCSRESSQVLAGTAGATGNVASRLSAVARVLPGGIAIAEPSGPAKRDGSDRDFALTTFKTLDERSSQIARGLLASGIEPGMRLVSLVPFGAQFIELVFAMMKAGVVVVLIDPGMDRKHLIGCLQEVNPDGFLGIPKAQAIRTILRSKFPNAKHNITVGRRWFWGGKTLKQIMEMGNQDPMLTLPDVQTHDDAAVIFTTGSTGPPKGVAYTHQTFHAQIDRIRNRYEIRQGSRDLACFPLFGLFDAVMGVTTVIPDMDPIRPADVDPQKLIQAARQWEVDQSFGSPALWKTVTRWCEANAVGRPFPTLKRVLSAGAPVPAATLQSLRRFVHEDAKIETPYGATEALPIASIESRVVIAETGPAAAKGKGVCVGSPFEGVHWKVIEIDDGPIASVDEINELPRGKIGELIVSGPMVTKRYVTRADQNALHKVHDESGGTFWHRMGDVGYLDEQNRFWFCGRKAHRIVSTQRTFFTIPCESVFNVDEQVDKCALVGVGGPGQQIPVLVVQPVDLTIAGDSARAKELEDKLRERASRNPLTRRIDRFVIRDQPLPVDIRHNSKIFREKLAAELNQAQS